MLLERADGSGFASLLIREWGEIVVRKDLGSGKDSPVRLLSFGVTAAAQTSTIEQRVAVADTASPRCDIDARSERAVTRKEPFADRIPLVDDDVGPEPV